MITRWALVASDFRREYGMASDELAQIGLADFQLYVRGLSNDSRFRQAWSDAPKHVYDPAQLEAIKAAAMR